MYTERTTLTGFFVDPDAQQLCLSVPAAELYAAVETGDVVMLSWQTTDDYNNIITKYSRLVSASRSPLDVTEDVSYTFVFDNGETYSNDGNVYAERTYGDTDVPADPQTGGGSGGGVLVVTDIGGMLDKTWQEIHDAPFATLVMSDETVYVLDSRYELNGTYVVCFYNSTGSETREYHATSASRHPSTPNSEA